MNVALWAPLVQQVPCTTAAAAAAMARQCRMACLIAGGEGNSVRLFTMAPKQMTCSDDARIQSAEAKASGGGVDKGGFAARAQAAAAKNEAAGQGQQGGKK